MIDRDESNYDQETSRRLIRGIVNNYKSLLPNPKLSAIEKRRALGRFGLSKPIDIASSQIPMISLPKEIDPILKSVAIKVGLSLFYRHKGAIAKPHYGVAAYWSQWSDKIAMNKFAQVAEDLGAIEVPGRSNLNFGNRFRYRWARESEGEPDIFMTLAQFGLGLTILVMIADISSWDKEDTDHDWVTVREWASDNFIASAAHSPLHD